MINIATLDYPLAGEGVVNTSLDGAETLLDADIVLIDPSGLDYAWSNPNGIGIFSDGERYLKHGHVDKVVKKFRRRNAEISTLLKKGKIIVVFMTPVNAIRASRQGGEYETITNYDILPDEYPISNYITAGTGNSRALVLKEKPGVFSAYYKAFKNELQYVAYLDVTFLEQHTFLTNKSDKAVGCTLKIHNGLVAFLPPPTYNRENKKLYSFLVNCANSYLKAEVTTPPPSWLNNFRLNGEEQYSHRVEAIELKIRELQAQAKEIEAQKSGITKFKSLLFEQGPKLECIVIESFKLFGFKAENRAFDDIEHDIIFESIEGRGIAELEGKDDSAINISKLDQLNRAVDEDFDLTDSYPQGILIGNHYRLTNPENRKPPFTDKVLIVAKKKSYGLLTTLEIYNAIEKILLNPKDEDFKKHCREKILSTTGEIIKLV